MIHRAFNPARDYPAFTALFNAAWPDDPRTSEELEGRDREPAQNGFLERQVVEQNGRLVGEASLRQWPGWKDTGRFWLNLTLHPGVQPDPIRDPLFRWAMERLAHLEAQSIFTWARSDRERRVTFLRGRGFTVVQEERVSSLALDTFQPQRFHQRVAAVISSGIGIYSLLQLRHLDPGWFEKLHELDNETHADVPDVIDFVPRDPEQLRRRLAAPDIIPEGYFVAVDGSPTSSTYVGLSRLGRRAAASKELDTGLTGVRRAYRRRGIALTLKVAALRWARAAGYETVWTGNEKQNPMYKLNRQLGFEPVYAGLTFEKRLA